jgi:hypothetical protein
MALESRGDQKVHYAWVMAAVTFLVLIASTAALGPV